MPTYMLLSFLSIVGLVSYGLHAYLFSRLPAMFAASLPDVAHTLTQVAESGWLVVTLSALTLSYFTVGSTLSPRRFRVLGWLSGMWMGALTLGSLWAGLHHLTLVLSELFGWLLPPTFGVAGLIATSALWVLGLFGALRPPRLTEVSIELANLPSPLDGLRIVQLSDVHVGPTIGRRFVADVVARTNALTPDLIVITGDLVDGDVALLRDDVAPVFELRAPLGVFFITGNHELISGVDPWVDHIRAGGITVLENESRRIDHGGATLNLVGVEDWDSARFHPARQPNLGLALAGVDTGHTTILLAHQPKAVREASLRGIDLQLSGHTHGGQMVPFTWLISLDQPHRSGLYSVGATQLYVSEGTGYWGPPLRLGTRSELTLLTLKSMEGLKLKR